MKRSAFIQRPAAQKPIGLAQSVAVLLGTARKVVKKEPSVMRSEQHRRNVAALACVCCGIEKRSQAAHLNLLSLGKGLGWKLSDALTIPLCVDQVGAIGCHVRLDSSGQYDKTTSEALQIAWFQDTRTQLQQRGKWSERAETDVVRFLGEYLKRAA